MTVKEKIVDFVKKQVSVDLDQYRTDFTKRFERRSFIIVDVEKIPKAAWRNVETLACCPYSTNIRIESFGTWGKVISFK